MVQLSFVSTAAALLLAALPLVAAAEPLQKPKQAAVLGSFTSQGCFSTDQGLKKQKSNSSASCGAACLEQTKLVFAMTGDACYCGDKYPPEVDIIDDAKCAYKCKGNKKEACGSKSDKRYSVWNSGVKLDVEYAKKKTSSTKTVTKLATKTPTATKSSKSTKTSKSTKKTPSSTATSQIETTTSDSVVSTSSSGNVPSGTSAAAQTSNTSGAVSRPMIGAGAAMLAAAFAI
ncbi:unnamed protein product [Clonostachys chloroleuca]|uniref:WSC domain-containing protein n=1 Tax=Clonostachys chloroleuca TaxID=1926264 RepID=A0AA35QBH6_9HYPO|nr:unnamed protein product [Clonostachys chloroleuca]